MSTDVLRRQLQYHLNHIRQLQARGLPPITCAFARLEGEPPGRDYRPRYAEVGPEMLPIEVVATDALFHPANHITRPCVRESHVTTFGRSHVHVLYPMPLGAELGDEWSLARTPALAAHQAGGNTPAEDALSLVRRVNEMLSPVAQALPRGLAERLGFDQTTRSYTWVEVLFHLGWHFPDHGIDACRYRILSATKEAPFDFPCPELHLQLGGVRASPDAFPGVILSRLGPISDFLTATVSALLLIVEALDGTERGAQPQPHPDFGRLHEEFRQLGEAFARHPRELCARVLRLDDSFLTPPATEWAGILRGGNGWGIPRDYILSHLDARRVVCVLHGPGLEQFHELANRAGSLLPCWSTQPYPAVLSDVGGFARYCAPEQFAWAIHAGDGWNRGLVTDHRGNVERWLGLAFALLMRERLDHFDFLTRPEDAARTAMGSPVNAMLTLRELNMFSACARALELSGLIPAQTLSADLPVEVPPIPVPTPEDRVPQIPTADRNPQPLLLAEIEQLLAEARRAYADPKLGFTLVAIPCPPESGGKVRSQRCEDDSPDAGEIRDGIFYWPIRSYQHYGSANIGELGSFICMALYHGRDRNALPAFSDFSRRAAAALLAAAPPWADIRHPGDAGAMWVSALIFVAPSTRAHVVERASGPRILSNPWAASIAALRDILSPPVGVPGPNRARSAEDGGKVSGDRAATDPAPVTALVVDDAGLSVLTALRDARPKLLKNVEIEAAASLSKQTVTYALTYLIDKKLATRPRGKRKGATVTAEGLALLESVRKSSVDHP